MLEDTILELLTLRKEGKRKFLVFYASSVDMFRLRSILSELNLDAKYVDNWAKGSESEMIKLITTFADMEAIVYLVSIHNCTGWRVKADAAILCNCERYTSNTKEQALARIIQC